MIAAYAARGSAEPDGFLASKNAQDVVNALEINALNVQAYLDFYQWQNQTLISSVYCVEFI